MADAARSRRRLWVEGGEIFPRPAHPRSPAGHARLAILIHGFNNDEEDARTNYLQAKARLAGAGVRPDVVNRIWELFWPSYVPALTTRLFRVGSKQRPEPRGSKVVSALSYAAQVSKAKRVADLLARYLVAIAERTEPPVGLILVGHSLGCRLILETIERMRTIRAEVKPHVVASFLMAAAVQVDMIRSPLRKKDKRSTPAGRFTVPERTFCLFSRDDRVLQMVFPIGQAAAGEWQGMLGYPEAVGRFGRPPEARWAGEEDTLLGHGMYWWSEATSRHLASLFGVPPPHFLRTWPQVPVESLQAWETPVSRHDF